MKIKKFIIVMGMLMAMTACGDARKTAEDADIREAVRLDSITSDIDKSGEELESAVDAAHREVNELLEGI